LDFSLEDDNDCCSLIGVVWISLIGWENTRIVGDWINASLPLTKFSQVIGYSWVWSRFSVRFEFKRGIDDKLSSCVLLDVWVVERKFLFDFDAVGMSYMTLKK